jgi:hypothetical protein
MVGIWIGDQRHPQLAEDQEHARMIVKNLGRKVRNKLVRFVTEPGVLSWGRGKVHRGVIGPRGGVQHLRRMV